MTGPSRQSAPSPTGTFSCVVDRAARFHLEALRWYASLTGVAGVDPSDLVVHAVGSTRSEALDYLVARGVTVRSCEAFDPRSPHCNKISGAQQLAERGVAGLAVLCDTDVGILEDPRLLDLGATTVAAKLVDVANPPVEVLRKIFSAADVELPPLHPLPWDADEVTVAGNANGGLYLVPGPLLAPLVDAWAFWARWLLERADLLGRWAVHVDQVAMALAVASQPLGWEPLDARWNTPVHEVARIPDHVGRPAVIHYHQELDPSGLIRLTGAEPIDRGIAELNEAIEPIWRRALPVATFWDWRHDPASRAGTQPWLAESKRRLLDRVFEAVGPTSVLDVGCGDGSAVPGRSSIPYTGIDISAGAIARARTLGAGGEFVEGTLLDHPRSADVVVCLDVLELESDISAYRQLIERLWHATGRALVVSGWDHPPACLSPIEHFHEPLSRTLRALAPDAELYPIRHEGERATLLVLRPPRHRHPRDYGAETLAALVADHPDPLMLAQIRLLAWRTLTFYPDHAPRLWEYPIVARLIGDALAPGGRVVDVGAGVNPLAPFLSSQGLTVDTVDPSPIRRSWPPTPDWNEWDFLDYPAAGLAHRSWNCPLHELPGWPLFDGVYSVSVIEHLRAVDRRALLGDMALRLRPGGIAVLTVDLVRGGDDLWNRNRGEVVESGAGHGTLSAIVAEAAGVGLDLVRLETVREWGDVSVDIGLLVLRRSSTGGLGFPARRVSATVRSTWNSNVRSRAGGQ